MYKPPRRIKIRSNPNDKPYKTSGFVLRKEMSNCLKMITKTTLFTQAP
jgi:hypothetical protein